MPTPPLARLELISLEDRWTPAAGDLDAAFGTQGVVRFPSAPVAGGTTYTGADQIAPMPDGRLVVAGQQFDTGPPQDPTQIYQVLNYRVRLTRLLPDGRPDASFGTNGAVVVPLTAARAILVQADGAIVLADGGGNGAGGNVAVARVTADGRLDTAFGDGGISTVPGAFVNATVTLAATPDGGVVLAGTVAVGGTTPQGFPFTAFGVARLTQAGRLDPAFDGDGVAAVPFPVGSFNQAAAAAVAVQPDGKVVVGGSAVARSTTTFFRSMPSTFDYKEAAVARLNADGSPDVGFGVGGRAQFRFGGTETTLARASGIQIRPDGRILIAGQGDVLGLAALTPAGVLDPTFDGDGVSLTTFTAGSLVSTTFLPDGGVFLSHGPTAYRLTANGQPDPAFGPFGAAILQPANGSASGASLAVGPAAPLPDGSVAAVGSLAQVREPADGVVYRYRGALPDQFPAPSPGRITVSGVMDGSFSVLDRLTAADGVYAAVGGTAVYAGFTGNVRVAVADVTGDGAPDYVTGPGPGGGPNVVVLDGRTGARVADLDAFETTFTGGVYVAAADLNADGKAEVVVTPDLGGGPVVVVYDGAGLAAGRNEGAERTRFFGIDDPAFRGGARAALGDVDGDVVPDLVVAAGFGGGPRVAVYSGAGLASSGLATRLVPDFFVFEQTLRNGVYVAAGDLTGDGRADLVFGGGPGGGPRVFALNGRGLVNGTTTPVANFFAGNPIDRGGVRVAVRTDLMEGSSNAPRIVTGSGAGVSATVGVYDPAAATAGGGPDRELGPFGRMGLADGVYVG